MKTILILAFVILVAIFVIIVLGKLCNSLQDEKTRLEIELAKQKGLSEELKAYAKELLDIYGDKDEVAQKINEAKTDEELYSVIAGLVHANNDRVCK